VKSLMVHGEPSGRQMHAPFWQLPGAPVICWFVMKVQAVPSGVVGFEQVPVVGSQVPATWHWSSAVQTVAGPGWQAPAWQVSPTVQASPSLHRVPVSGGFVQVPVAGSQTPTA
jgi:hypothetical protein